MLKLILVLGAAVVIIHPAPAQAEVSATCKLHLERVSKATGQIVTAAADRRHWAARGQVSQYCSEQDEAEEATQSTEAVTSRDEYSDKPDEGKSRYCRKKWFC